MWINIRWISDIPTERLANVEINSGFGTFIDLGALDGDELCSLAQHLRDVADKLDPQEDN